MSCETNAEILGPRFRIDDGGRGMRADERNAHSSFIIHFANSSRASVDQHATAESVRPSTVSQGSPRMKIHVGVSAVAIVICSTVAYAQSLKDKEYFAGQDKYLADKVPYLNEKCGTSLAVKIDWSTPPAPEDRNTYSAYGHCEAALDGLRRVCEMSPAGKDAVKQKIKSVTCGFGPQRSVALKEGAIDYKINYKQSSNDADFVFEYLQNNL
jgi:hypothetical protein